MSKQQILSMIRCIVLPTSVMGIIQQIRFPDHNPPMWILTVLMTAAFCTLAYMMVDHE